MSKSEEKKDARQVCVLWVLCYFETIYLFDVEGKRLENLELDLGLGSDSLVGGGGVLLGLGGERLDGLQGS